jgi:hypothetical protein
MKIKFALTAISVLVLTACGTSIGVKSDFKAGHFEEQQTTRDEVVRYLGLPQKILEDDAGRKHYFYEGSASLTGLCVGCGNVSAPPGLIPALISESGVKNGAEYVFDKEGLLVAKFEPKQKAKH